MLRAETTDHVGRYQPLVGNSRLTSVCVTKLAFPTKLDLIKKKWSGCSLNVFLTVQLFRIKLLIVWGVDLFPFVSPRDGLETCYTL